MPEGELVVRLFDGAIGPTQLAQAQATASLDAAQRLSFGMDFAPAEPRSGGFARVTGSLPLRPASTGTMLVTTGETTCHRPSEEHGQCLLEQESCLLHADETWPKLLLLLPCIRLTAEGSLVAVCHINLASCKQSANDLHRAEPDNAAHSVEKLSKLRCMTGCGAMTAGSAAVEEPPALGDSVEVGMRVKDGGMKLVGILTPDFRWQSGSADIELRLHGRPGALALDGGLHVSKATITSPFLKYPMTNVAAAVNLADNVVQVRPPAPWPLPARAATACSAASTTGPEQSSTPPRHTLTLLGMLLASWGPLQCGRPSELPNAETRSEQVWCVAGGERGGQGGPARVLQGSWGPTHCPA